MHGLYRLRGRSNLLRRSRSSWLRCRPSYCRCRSHRLGSDDLRWLLDHSWSGRGRSSLLCYWRRCDRFDLRGGRSRYFECEGWLRRLCLCCRRLDFDLGRRLVLWQSVLRRKIRHQLLEGFLQEMSRVSGVRRMCTQNILSSSRHSPRWGCGPN